MGQIKRIVGGKEVVEIKCEIVHETDKAILIGDYLGIDKHRVWIPLSFISEIHRTAGTEGYDTVVMSTWIAKQKGLEY